MTRLPETLTNLPWYLPSIGPMLTPECQELLSDYAQVPTEKHEMYIYEARDDAFATFPLGTIGEFWFLVLGLSEHPFYGTLLNRLRNALDPYSPVLVDLGTCLGQDLRKLVHDGASPRQLLGIDKFPQFAEIGFSFFRDSEKMNGRFLTADVFEHDESDALNETKGTWEVVTSSMFLHSFDWETQKVAVRKMFELARAKDSWLMGLMGGDLEEQDVPILPPLVPENVRVSRFIHSTTSLSRLLMEVGHELGRTITVHTSYQEDKESTYTKALAESYFASGKARLLFYFVEIL
ncbi:hypothetical protein BKA63DRAFT_444408 [Paraphoma chrysanthemicola]|nr:hypothetical protein BKA63DRAFT_444408 [Paraphoma chrysanthemicola]